MTLLDILPSLRAGHTTRLHPIMWPSETHHDDLGRVTIGGVALTEIADQYGTPTYVLDEEDIRRRCRVYRKLFPDAEIAYAGKALMPRSVVDWVTEQGLSLAVCSVGELAIAKAGGADPARMIMGSRIDV